MSTLYNRLNRSRHRSRRRCITGETLTGEQLEQRELLTAALPSASVAAEIAAPVQQSARQNEEENIAELDELFTVWNE